MVVSRRGPSIALLALATALGGPGLVAAQIRIGQTSGFTGAVAPGVKENTEGARLWIDHVNRQGGINGQKVELISVDDRFQPRQAAENARKLIVESDVIALFLNRGTPHTEAIRPLLEQYQVPLVAPSTGAMVLHSPVHPWIFNVRAPYQREAEKAVVHLATTGISRIAVLHVDDSFGADCLAGAAKGFTQSGLKPAFVDKFDRDKPDFAAVARRMAAEPVQALLFYGSTGAVAEGTKAIRTAGSRAQIVTASNNASGGFIQQMGEHGPGVIVTQVFPNERQLGVAMVREAHELARAKGLPGVTPAMLEGYAGAKVLLEGLRRAGASPTRAKLRTALDGMSYYDLGGLEVRFAPGDHTGLRYTELSIIGTDGKFRR